MLFLQKFAIFIFYLFLLYNISMSKIVLAQINSFTGDISSNTKKILDYINRAKNDCVDMIIFPESAIIGYPSGDIVLRHKNLIEKQSQALNLIADMADGIKVLLGFTQVVENNNVVDSNNAIAVMYNKRIMKVIDRNNYCDFPDTSNRMAQFVSGNIINSIKVNDEKFVIDFTDYFSNSEIADLSDVSLYPFLDKLNEIKPNFIIKIQNLPSRCGGEYLKKYYFSNIAQKFGVNYLYVNKVGYSDNYCFDGSSRMYDASGNVVARAKYLDEDYLVIESGKGIVNKIPCAMDTKFDFSNFDYSSDLERTYRNIIFSIKEYFSKNGFSKAVLGLSGGLDSSVSAVLLVDALGKDNVLGVSMPSKITSCQSKNDAKQLADNLGIKFIEVPLPNLIEPAKDMLSNAFSSLSFEKYDKSTTIENLQARTRATILWSISNEYKGMLPIATSDKSEAYIGYATVNGDMSGGFAPIADVTKTKLFALADYLNKTRETKNVIPQSVLEKPPGAELKINPKTGKTVCAEEDNMPYEFLDEIIWLVENHGFGYDELINHNYHYEINNPISIEQKTEWVKKYFWKSKCAVYKWHIMPASVIIDKHSIISPDYYQPILSKVY